MRGINAYIDETAANPALLPLEFQLLDITPQHWTPEVVISRHQGLVGNVTSEINNARAVALLGAWHGRLSVAPQKANAPT